MVLVVLLVIAGLVALFAYWLSNGPIRDDSSGPEIPLFSIQELDVAAGSAIPTSAPAVPATAQARTKWIDDMSANTDIPQRALQAYVEAAAITAQRHPSCHLQWTTLAAVGRVESDHGQHHDDEIEPNGVEQFPIVGPALDGSPGVQRIPDTDHGLLDGDTVWDHAIGPMQFLPSRWKSLGQRASGDGKAADPQNIDDAALTAATYLCESGNLASPTRWWRAAFHYNNSVEYGREVFSAADAYAKVGIAQQPKPKPAKPSR